MQRGPRERGARFLRFTIQRPGNLIYIPHLPAHVVLTVDMGSPTILSAWDAATTSNQQVIFQRLDEYTFGGRRVNWREIFPKKCLSALREWVFSPSTGLQESKDKLHQRWNYWEQHFKKLLSPLHIEKEVPVRFRVTPPPAPVQSTELRCTHKGTIAPRPST